MNDSIFKLVESGGGQRVKKYLRPYNSFDGFPHFNLDKLLNFLQSNFSSSSDFLMVFNYFQIIFKSNFLEEGQLPHPAVFRSIYS